MMSINGRLETGFFRRSLLCHAPQQRQAPCSPLSYRYKDHRSSVSRRITLHLRLSAYSNKDSPNTQFPGPRLASYIRHGYRRNSLAPGHSPLHAGLGKAWARRTSNDVGFCKSYGHSAFRTTS